MTTVPYMLTRGPLSSSVYWRRRLVAMSIAVVLVVAIAKMLAGGSGGGQAAEQVAHTGPVTSAAPSASTTPTGPAPSSAPSTTPGTTPSLSSSAGALAGPTTSAQPLSGTPATASGACQPSDVVVTPLVRDAMVGQPVTITLRVQTRTEPACYWQMNASSLQVKVDSAVDRVWSTADCRSAITPQQLTLSNAAPTQTSLIWRGHTSDSYCSGHTPWANQGTYTVTATALGGEPQTASFHLGVPTVYVTVTPTPSATATGPSVGASSGAPTRSPRASTSPAPSSGRTTHPTPAG